MGLGRRSRARALRPTGGTFETCPHYLGVMSSRPPMTARYAAKRILQAIFFVVVLAGVGSAIPYSGGPESPMVTIVVVLVGLAGLFAASYIPATN